MGTRRSLMLVAVVALGAAILAACGSPTGDVTALTPGPTPPARPGTYVWAVGAPDLVIGSADGGASWQVRHRRSDGDIMTGDLWAVAFGDAGHGWAVRRGVGSPVATILATSDAGKTWHWRYPGPTRGRLLSVAATDARHAWAAGYQSVYGSGYFQGKGLMLATTDGGKTWQRQRLPAGLVLSRVAFADAHRGWAVGEGDVSGPVALQYSVLSTSDGGAHWRICYTAASGASLYGLAAVGPDRCYVVGYAEQQHAGLVLRTTDAGLHWSAEYPIPHQNLRAVSFPDAGNGWAVGSGGTVLVTNDGGADWSPQHSGVHLDLTGVSFSDSLHGWALISARGLLTTGDGGKSWSVAPLSPGRDSLLLGLATVHSR